MIMKYIKYILIAVVAIVAVWFSFWTENLTEHRQKAHYGEYKPEEVVDYCWTNKMQELEDRALSVEDFQNGLSTDAADFCSKHGRVLGIGSNTFFIVKGALENININDEEITGICEGLKVSIPVKHIFGNTAREASGWFDIDDFKNTMDFNAVSEALNKRLTENIHKQLTAIKGNEINFLGAVEVNPDKLAPGSLTVIPFSIKK